MSYGLKYITNFDGGPQGNEPYTLEFYFKGWTGTFQNFLASGSPVTHRWDKDEPKPAIKGSSLTIEGINTGALPLSAFFADTDDNCKVIYKWGSQVLFAGFLVQDDCTEIMVDYSHIINFTATDNLGLLKDVAFDKANLIVGDRNRTISGIQAYSVPPVLPAAGYLFIASTTTGAVVGDTIIIEGTPGSDGIYSIVNIVVLGTSGTAIYLDRDFPFAIPNATTYTFTFITPANLNDRLSLAYLIRICLTSTNLLLNCDVYATIIESVTSTPRVLDETFLPGETFLDGNNYKSCYDVITIILQRFYACLFQAEGKWIIIRRDEHRYYDNEIPGYRYDSSMVSLPGLLVGTELFIGAQFTAAHTIQIFGTVLTYLPGQIITVENEPLVDGTYHITAVDNTIPTSPILTVTETVITAFASGLTIKLYDDIPLLFNDIFTAEPNTDPSLPASATYPITGITKSILRGFNFDKETFKYKQIVDLLKNSTLQILGPLINRYIDGANTVSEYALSLWYNYDASPGPYPQRLIRVIVDTVSGNEVTRYALVQGVTWDDRRSAQSTDIEVNEGDVIKYSFSYRTDVSLPGPGNVYFSVRAFDGSTYYYLDTATTEGEWLTTGAIRRSLSSADNQNQWFDVSATSKPLPFSGILNIYLAETTASSANETQYKNLSLEIIFSVNESTQIIGQTHTESQPKDIKNNEDIEILIDDSPRNSINGTLFLPTTTGLLRDRTTLWGYTPGGTRRLGEIITFEQLFWRRISRNKLEGTMYGLIQNVITHRDYPLVGTTGTLDVPSGKYIIYSPDMPVGVFVSGVVFTLFNSGGGPNDGVYTVDAVLDATHFTVVEPMSGSVDAGDYTLIIYSTERRHISMLTLIKYSGLPGLNFIFGTLGIDYKHNNFTGTFWEQWKLGEVDSDLIAQYNFKYLYQNT